LTAIFVAIFSLKETVTRDLSRIRPRALIASYRQLLATPYFMLASLVIANSLGAVFALATMLPFVLMDQVGLSPTGFGFSQILQAGMFVVGALVVRTMLPRYGADRLVPMGLSLLIVACLGLVVFLLLWGTNFFSVMMPIAVYSFGVAFIMPAMLTNSLAPFPRMAGAASALTAFLQMALGLLGSAIASFFANPSLALIIVLPTMGVSAAVCWHFWRKLPMPLTQTGASRA
jgi:DHA1 family bicyclomycin/chloramphenicol resistance-like MFS transporter